MSFLVSRLREPSIPKEFEFEERLVQRVVGYISKADEGEDARRMHDRRGGKLYYGQHWDRPMPSDRAAISANLGMTLVEQKIAIMTKQDPIPVVEPDDVGDVRSAELMGMVVRRAWLADGMRLKLRRLLRQGEATRTAALKVLWDPSLKGGAGDITTDNVPGWRLLVDNTVSDTKQQQFAGDRATMTRSRCMLMYPKAAEKIATMRDFQTNRQGPLRQTTSPLPTPWKAPGLPPPGASVVNGKPVITSFAGEIGGGGRTDADMIDVVELYHRDFTLVKDMRPVRDELGRVKQQIVNDEETGLPKFEEAEPDQQYVEGVGFVDIPNFELVMEDEMEEALVRKYPFYRRTTVAMQGVTGGSSTAVLLEDRAWDGPLPYCYYTGGEPLDGILGRGPLLQCEHLQALVNVSLSTTIDNYRMGSLNAWLAGNQSGLAATQIIPGVGQVIPVNDVSAVKPLESPNIDQAIFGLLDKAVTYMERIIGATGVMQGESVGRADSAGTYDTLAEIGGARLVEATQRMESTLEDWAAIVGWYAQQYYDERHAIAVEDIEGNLTWERASSPLLQGSFSYTIATGSTLAWSDSAKAARDLQEYQNGLIDKVEYYKRRKTPHWKEIMRRVAANPASAGPAGAPPPRTRTSPKKAQTKTPKAR